MQVVLEQLQHLEEPVDIVEEIEQPVDVVDGLEQQQIDSVDKEPAGS